MSLSTRSFVPFAAASVLALTGSADAAFFSFASDSGPNGSSNWTFTGTAGVGTSFGLRHGPAAGPLDVRLHIDDNDGLLPTVNLDVGFTANLTATWQNTTAAGSFALHNYLVTGSFTFVDRATGAALLTGTIGGGATPGPQSALLTVPGTASQWSTTGAVIGSDAAGGDTAVTWTVTPALFALAGGQGVNLGQYNMVLGNSLGPDDFAFDLSFINAAGLPVQLNGATRLPESAFNAESSFSGTYVPIPAPGAAGLAAVGLLSLGRRRR